MADSETENYALIKPEVGGSDGTWGEKLNDNFDSIDSLIAGVSAANIQIFEESGTYTPSEWCKKYSALVVGGGAGGGSGITTRPYVPPDLQIGWCSVGGGGGAGGQIRTGLLPIDPETYTAEVTVGTAGAGSLAGGFTGGSGTASIIYHDAAIISAGGGVGGTSAVTTQNYKAAQGGNGGASNAPPTVPVLFSKNGAKGGSGFTGEGDLAIGGKGGDSITGAGGVDAGVFFDTGPTGRAGQNASGYGAGGSGGSSVVGSQSFTTFGGAGSPGVVIIFEYP